MGKFKPYIVICEKLVIRILLGQNFIFFWSKAIIKLTEERKCIKKT